nr:DUF4123 domain-containing protein [Jannaschia sp. Os4]
MRRRLFPETAPGADGVETATFAVLDAARVFGLPEILAGSGLDHLSLFQGAAAADHAETAPYLVKLRPGHGLTARLLGAAEEDPLAWPAAPGLLLRAPLGLRGLRRQLRGYTFVQDEARGRRLYFRYYDPRVFAATILRAQEPVRARFMRGIESVTLNDGGDDAVELAAEAP